MSQAISLHGHTHPRLGYYLVAAIVSGALAMPIGMLWTKLLVTKTPPTETAPAASKPAEVAPSLGSVVESATREATPSAALPRENPAENAPSVGAPTATIPTVTVPTETLSREAPSALLSRPVEGVPDIAVAPTGSSDYLVSRPGGKRADRAQASAHAQVVALLNMLAHKKAGVQPAIHAANGSGANNGTRGRSGTTPRSVGNSMITAATESSVDHRAPGTGVLGGPATNSASNTGLNGTRMRRNP